MTATQRKHTIESHICSEETNCIESQPLIGNTLQNDAATKKTQTAWKDSY